MLSPKDLERSIFIDILSLLPTENRRVLLLFSFPFPFVHVFFMCPNNHIFHFPPIQTPCSSPFGPRRTRKCHWSQTHSPRSPESWIHFRMGSQPCCHSHKTRHREWLPPNTLGMKCSSGLAGSRLNRLHFVFVWCCKPLGLGCSPGEERARWCAAPSCWGLAAPVS